MDWDNIGIGNVAVDMLFYLYSEVLSCVLLIVTSSGTPPVFTLLSFQ